MTAGIRGVLSAIATPLSADGQQVDVDTLRGLVDWQLAEGIDGFVPCGSTGEFAYLSRAEREQIVETVLGQVDGRVPVLPQICAMSTSESIALAKHAQANGATGVMAVAPYYEPLTTAEVFGFYRDIASAVDLPLMIYNLPIATGIKLGLEEMTALVDEIETVKYVKDTSGDFALGAQLIHSLGERVDVFVGWDPLYFAALMEGAAGSVIGAANVAPAQLAAVCDDVASGSFQAARSKWQTLYPVLEQIVSKPYNASIKAGMVLVGHGGGPLRSPQLPLDADARQALAKRLTLL